MGSPLDLGSGLAGRWDSGYNLGELGSIPEYAKDTHSPSSHPTARRWGQQAELQEEQLPQGKLDLADREVTGLLRRG